MNAFELLKKDHESVSSTLEKLAETTARGVRTREELFEKLKTELDLHAQIEEQIFYPALKEFDETREVIIEAFEEHALVKQLLSDLDSAPKDDKQWGAKLAILKLNIEHHVKEEEGEMFSRAREVLSPPELEDLGARLLEEKKAALAATGRF